MWTITMLQQAAAGRIFLLITQCDYFRGEVNQDNLTAQAHSLTIAR